MAIYTIIAGDRKTPVRPCWMLEAASADAALKMAWTLREHGSMPWLPVSAAISVRKSSKIERVKYVAAITGRPVGGPSISPDESGRRAERLKMAFFKRLWTGS